MTPSRRARRTIALAVLAGLTLTGCGAGINAQTNQRRTFAEGTNEVLPGGQILIRNFYLAPPRNEQGLHRRGDDVRAYAVFVNQGDEDDRLVRVTSPAAQQVTLWSGGDPQAGVAEHTEQFLELYEPAQQARPGGTDNRAVPGGEAGDVEAGESPGASPAGSPSPPVGASPAAGEAPAAGEPSPGESPSADGQQVQSFLVPLGDKTEVLPGSGYMLFEGLREDVYPGMSIEVTVEFERAGSHTFPAYVHLLGGPVERETPSSELEGTNEREADQSADLEPGA